MSVGRICQRSVDVAEPHESVCTAAERMHQRSVGALVVVDRNSRPLGILTDRDLVVRILARGSDPFATAVESVMTPVPKTVVEHAPIEDALSLMRSGAFRRLPVVDGEGALVGLVTLDDILMLLSEEFLQVGRLLEQETPRAAAMESARCD
jgi:CBS domain-containing protein